MRAYLQRCPLLRKMPACAGCYSANADISSAAGLLLLVIAGASLAWVRQLLTAPSVAASEDASVRLWDLETGVCQQCMEGHTSKVMAMALGMEGGLLVTGSADMTAKVWDVQQGHCLATLTGHTADISAVAVDSKGRFCATASSDGTCRLWSLANGKCALVLSGSTASGVSPLAHLLEGSWSLGNGRCARTPSGSLASSTCSPGAHPPPPPPPPSTHAQLAQCFSFVESTWLCGNIFLMIACCHTCIL